MKKIFCYAAALATMLFAASCQKETLFGGQDGDEVTATLTIQAPEQLVTKAVGDGQTADNLVFAVFDEEGYELGNLRQGDWRKNQAELVFDNSAKPQLTLTTTLARGKEYTFVCWAQNKEADCYDFTNMKVIGINYNNNYVAQDEKRDAFFAAVQSGKVTANFSQTIELYRPFAQVNVGTADIQAAFDAGVDVTKLRSTMTLTNAATELHTFVGAKAEDNDGDGKVRGAETVTFEVAPAISKSNWDGTNAAADHEWLTINHKDYKNKTYGWLAMNYILVNDGDEKGEGSVDGTEQALSNVSFTIYEESLELCSYDVPNVPVQRNYRSHILGDGLLTADGTITVIIEPAFLEPDYVVNVWDGISTSKPAKDAEGNYLVTKPEELAWFQKNTPDANIRLVNDIDLAGQVWTPISYFNGEKVLTFEGLPVTKAGETYPTIYGLNINQTSGKAAGLFGGVTFNFKNFNIDGAECNCVSSFVGAVAGQVYGDLENISVKNVNFVADPSRKDIRYGAIVGMHNAGNATDCSVENAVVKAYHNVGGIAGTVNESNKNRTYRNCSVKESTLELYCTEGAGAKMVGALTGNANGVTLYYEDCTAEGNNVNALVGAGTSVDLKVPVLEVKETEFEVAYDATEVEIEISSNVAWTVAGEGVKAEPAAGEGDAKVVLTFAANEAYEAKTYEVTVASEAEVEAVTVTIAQEAAPEPEPEFVTATVAEFLAAAEDDTMYQLTGVITKVTNTSFGNFDITDETGTVYVYGLCSPEGVQKYWAESGSKLGDTITIQTKRTSYNGSPQGKDALFVELTPFVATESEWGVVGDLTNWADGSDIKMYTTWKAKDLFVAYNVEIASGAFKVRANNEWNNAKNYGLEVAGKIYADSYYSVYTDGGSKNITPMEYGTYDVYFDLANKRVALVTPGKEYADAENGGDPVVVIEGLKEHTWGLIGSFAGSGWSADVNMEVVGDWAVAKNVTLANGNEFKFRADGAWALSYGSACDVNVGETYTTYNNGGNMKFVGEAGAYNIYFSLIDAKFYIETYISATTAEATMANFGWANAALVETVTLDDNVTLTFEKGGASTAPAYYTSGEAVRLYQNGAIMNVSASGRTITSIEITFANNMYYLAADSGEFTEEAAARTWTGSAETVKFTCTGTDKNHRAYIQSIKVTYE
ncbi:MAG: hypothetical protein J6A22_03630 [Bacteroidales bacterium]|nr:hypothetical protein [Bacteroidales bacterium]